MKTISANRFSARDKRFFAFILLYTLLSVKFLSPTIVDLDNVSKYLYALLNVIILPVFLLSYIKKNKGEAIFKQSLKILTIGVLVSIMSAYYVRNQSIYDCLLGALYPVAGYTMYFYLLEKKIKISIIERVITVLGIISIGAFLLNFLLFPVEIFANSFKEDLLSRGFQRIQLKGFGFIYLMFFFSINRYVILKERKWLVISISAYLCIILSLTRTYVLFSGIIAMLYFLGTQKIQVKILSALLLVGAFIYISNLDFVANLVETTNNDFARQDDYIRIQSAYYFLNDFQISWFTRTFGSGFANGIESEYGRLIESLKKTQYYYIDDLGLIGFYVYIGWLGLLSYVIIFYKGLRKTLNPNIVYVKMFLIFLLLISLNSYASYSPDFLLCIVFMLYIYELNGKKEFIESNIKNIEFKTYE